MPAHYAEYETITTWLWRGNGQMDKKDKLVMQLFYRSHGGTFGRVLAVANNRSSVWQFAHILLVIALRSRVAYFRTRLEGPPKGLLFGRAV